MVNEAQFQGGAPKHISSCLRLCLEPLLPDLGSSSAWNSLGPWQLTSVTSVTLYPTLPEQTGWNGRLCQRSLASQLDALLSCLWTEKNSSTCCPIKQTRQRVLPWESLYRVCIETCTVLGQWLEGRGREWVSDGREEGGQGTSVLCKDRSREYYVNVKSITISFTKALISNVLGFPSNLKT